MFILVHSNSSVCDERVSVCVCLSTQICRKQHGQTRRRGIAMFRTCSLVNYAMISHNGSYDVLGLCVVQES